MAKSPCKATNKAGLPCRASAWANGYCIAHQPAEVRKAVGHKSGTRDGQTHRDGSRAIPIRVPELAKRIVEANAAAVLYPYLRALGLKAMREKASGQIVVVPDPAGRARLYGTSKDGRVVMSSYEDLGAMIAAAEKLLDRIYGRPKQALSIAGEPGQPGVGVQVSVAGDQNRAFEVAQILASAGAVSTGSRN